MLMQDNMKAKVKYQEIEYIQYDGTNKKEIEEFIGQQCGEYKQDIYHWIYFLIIVVDNIQIQVNNRDVICKTNDGNIFVLSPESFIKMFTGIDGVQSTLSLY